MHLYINRTPFILNNNKYSSLKSKGNLIAKTTTFFEKTLYYIASNVKADNTVINNYSKQHLGFLFVDLTFNITAWKYKKMYYNWYYSNLKKKNSINGTYKPYSKNRLKIEKKKNYLKKYLNLTKVLLFFKYKYNNNIIPMYAKFSRYKGNINLYKGVWNEPENFYYYIIKTEDLTNHWHSIKKRKEEAKRLKALERYYKAHYGNRFKYLWQKPKYNVKIEEDLHFFYEKELCYYIHERGLNYDHYHKLYRLKKKKCIRFQFFINRGYSLYFNYSMFGSLYFNNYKEYVRIQKKPILTLALAN